jgi:PBP1b-binding outer membrane lipoprotein LpoB
MSKNKTKSVLTALSMAILLVGCNNNEDDPVAAKSLAKPTTPTIKTLTVTPSLGKI